MFDRPPKEREIVSWGYALAWATLTFVTVPYVRVGVTFVREHLGFGFFTYAVVTVVVLALASALYVTRQRWTLSSCLCLLGLAGLIIYLTFGLAGGSAVEAVHFVQYGTLSVLLFRAFSHRVRDYSIYFAATITGTFLGMIDETVQWLTPGRVFDVRDIWLNLKAIGVVQIGLALGIRPKLISGLPGWISLRRLCFLGAATLAYLGLCLQNTPDRISWYATHVPGLRFIDPAQNVMVEYGYFHRDADGLAFRSRLTLEELRLSTERHAEAGIPSLDLIDQAEETGSYWDAHSRYDDLYLYEGRIHQIRRDQNIKRAEKSDAADQKARYLAAAHWENVILNNYFSEILPGSRFEWPPDTAAEVQNRASLDAAYTSDISTHLITAHTRGQLAVFFSVAVAALLVLGFVFGRAAGRVDTQ